jgi:hypothetical protein
VFALSVCHGLDFDETIGHGNVDGFALDKVASETSYDLADGFDEGADLDGSYGGGY